MNSQWWAFTKEEKELEQSDDRKKALRPFEKERHNLGGQALSTGFWYGVEENSCTQAVPVRDRLHRGLMLPPQLSPQTPDPNCEATISPSSYRGMKQTEKTGKKPRQCCNCEVFNDLKFLLCKAELFLPNRRTHCSVADLLSTKQPVSPSPRGSKG